MAVFFKDAEYLFRTRNIEPFIYVRFGGKLPCIYAERQSEQAMRAIFFHKNLRIFYDRESNLAMAEGKWAVAYYDLYMRISDYNCLEEMLGLRLAVLRDDQYLFHIPNRKNFFNARRDTVQSRFYF